MMDNVIFLGFEEYEKHLKLVLCERDFLEWKVRMGEKMRGFCYGEIKKNRKLKEFVKDNDSKDSDVNIEQIVCLDEVEM